MSRFWQRPLHDIDRIATIDELASLAKATAWINSSPLTAASLRGKVVLVQFCTFTCINWLRTLPYTRAWVQAYKSAGLVTIGVHTPEFEFEHDLENIRRALAAMRVDYPIAVDNDYEIWGGFSNQYWPALYLLDGMGRVRHQQFGEGGYVESERMIQQLLTASGARDIRHEPTAVEGRGIEAPADWANLRSAENYVGSERTEGFASLGGIVSGSRRRYGAPRELRLNQWALDGEWTVEKGFILSSEPNGKIIYRFHGRDLHLVMGPPRDKHAVRFRVTLDGQPVGEAHGGDVDEQGNGIASTQRLYQLIRQPKPIVERVLQIEFMDPGVEAFSFTFG